MAPPSKTPKSSTAKSGAARKPNPAFMKPMTPSPTLAAIIGPKARPRTEVIKDIWDYIKKHNRQDAQDKRKINAQDDEKLRDLFDGQESVSMFDLTKLVSKHLTKAE